MRRLNFNMLPNKLQTIRRHCDSLSIYHSPTNQKTSRHDLSGGWEKCRWQHTARSGLKLHGVALFWVSLRHSDASRAQFWEIHLFKYGKMIFRHHQRLSFCHIFFLLVDWIPGDIESISHIDTTLAMLNYIAIRAIREWSQLFWIGKKERRQLLQTAWTEINDLPLICFDLWCEIFTPKKQELWHFFCCLRFTIATRFSSEWI